MKCKEKQVQDENVAIDYRNAARCKSYSDGRQCWRNTSVHGHVACLVGRARDPLDDKVRLALEPSGSTCVCGCRVCMICAFCISAAVLRAVFSCIVAVYALWCSQKIESDSRDSACEPAPSPLLRSSLTHAHRCIGPRKPSRPTPTSARLMCLGVSDSRDSTYTLSTSSPPCTRPSTFPAAPSV
jgi:hypothetical protein